jgi:hypothetical protein
MLDQSQVFQKLSQSQDGSQSMFYGQMIADLDFRNHTFESPVNFSAAIFTGDVDFSGAVFKEFSAFDSALFQKSACFRTCSFEKGTSFSLAALDEEVDFFQARIYGKALFWRAFFRKAADFSQIRVSRADWLPPAHDGEANFSWARFYNNAVFTYAEIEWPVYFHRTLFEGDVYLDQCRFDDVVYLHGKENEALFPRFGAIDPATVGDLESTGVFRPDTERHRTYRNRRVSEFVCFNNILSEANLIEKLGLLPDSVSEQEMNAICAEWRKGARKMFADGRCVSFRGTTFADLDKLACRYVDLRSAIIDRHIAGPPENRRAFEARLKAESYDVFISHASEDKAALVRPLAERLRAMGYVPWFDERQIETGDELVKSLDAGIRCSRCGLVVISKAFLSQNKRWGRYEVEQLLNVSRGSGRKLLFVWHGVTENEVRTWSAELADRAALDTDRYRVDELALELARTIR